MNTDHNCLRQLLTVERVACTDAETLNRDAQYTTVSDCRATKHRAQVAMLAAAYTGQQSGTREAHWDSILIEDDVMGKASVVDKLDGLASGHAQGAGHEGKGAIVTSELHSRGVGSESEAKSHSSGSSSLSDLLHRHGHAWRSSGLVRGQCERHLG